MKSILLKTIFILSFSLSSYGEQKTYKLSYTPYSSTYLPNQKGEIIRNDHETDEIYAAYQLLRGLNEDALSMSPLHKFDLIREKFTNRNISLVETYGDMFYDRSKSSWEGYCDNWSAANSNPLIPDLIKNTEAVICNGILLSRGELKELFTALYDIRREDNYFWGKRNVRDKMPGGKANKIYSELGYDDLSAHLMQEKIITSLENDETVTLDVDAGTEVWNHPITEAQFTTKKLTLKEIKENKRYYNVLPSYIFDLKGSKLSQLNEVERHLIAKAEKFSGSSVNKLLRKRRKLKKSHYKSINEHPLDDDYTVKHVSLELQIALEEITFASESAEPKVGIAPQSFEYLVIEHNGEIIDSVWLTNPRWRPDFLWKPKKNIEQIDEAYPRLIGAWDLYNLIKDNKCSKIERITEFLDGLVPLLKSSVFQEKWLEVEAHKYKDIIPYIPETSFQELEETYGQSLALFYKDSKL